MIQVRNVIDQTGSALNYKRWIACIQYKLIAIHLMNSRSFNSLGLLMNEFQNASSKCEIKSLKKIRDNDKFPCFSCFDSPTSKIHCQDCNAQGYILGSHPMVQFAEDYIEKKFASMGFQMNDGQFLSGNQQLSNNTALSSNMSSSYATAKKKDDFRSSKSVYINGINEAEEKSESSQKETYKIEEECQDLPTLMSSSYDISTKNEEVIHYQNFCDHCANDQPIKGIRFQCLECKEYDLCELCYRNQVHFHKMKRIQKPEIMSKSVHLKEQTIKQLKKSLKYR